MPRRDLCPSLIRAGDKGVLTGRMEHAYRQSMPEQYGIGLGAMSGLAGGQGFGSLPGTQQMLYGRGGGYGVGFNGPA